MTRDAAQTPERLKRRADFLAAASGVRAHSSLMTLQAYARDDNGRARLGFTVTRRTGGAVERNRIRRRLRVAVTKVAPTAMRAGHDYVIVGRRGLLDAPFERIVADLDRVLRRVHKTGDAERAPER